MVGRVRVEGPTWWPGVLAHSIFWFGLQDHVGACQRAQPSATVTVPPCQIDTNPLRTAAMPPKKVVEEETGCARFGCAVGGCSAPPHSALTRTAQACAQQPQDGRRRPAQRRQEQPVQPAVRAVLRGGAWQHCLRVPSQKNSLVGGSAGELCVATHTASPCATEARVSLPYCDTDTDTDCHLQTRSVPLSPTRAAAPCLTTATTGSATCGSRLARTPPTCTSPTLPAWSGALPPARGWGMLSCLTSRRWTACSTSYGPSSLTTSSTWTIAWTRCGILTQSSTSFAPRTWSTLIGQWRMRRGT